MFARSALDCAWALTFFGVFTAGSNAVTAQCLPSDRDCNGECFGVAVVDDCAACSGGNTGRAPNADKDCAGICFGDAVVDCFGVCGGSAVGCCQSDADCGHLQDDCATGVCNVSLGVCEQVFLSSSTVCRSAAGLCDVDERCTGTSAACPTESCAAAGVACGENRECDGRCECVTVCPPELIECPTGVCVVSAEDCSSTCSVVCGDLDADRDVDGDDFSLFLASFGRSAGDQLFSACADSDGDQSVTFVDFQSWLQCYRAFINDDDAGSPDITVQGDFDADSDVDLVDFSYFQTCFSGAPDEFALPCELKFDFDGNGAIDLDDFGGFYAAVMAER